MREFTEREILFAILERMYYMSDAMDNLIAQVTNANTVNASAVALIAGFADQVKQAAGDPAKLSALADSLKSSEDSLAAAVAANTPATPTPAPTPAPTAGPDVPSTGTAPTTTAAAAGAGSNAGSTTGPVAA